MKATLIDTLRTEKLHTLLSDFARNTLAFSA